MDYETVQQDLSGKNEKLKLLSYREQTIELNAQVPYRFNVHNALQMQFSFEEIYVFAKLASLATTV